MPEALTDQQMDAIKAEMEGGKRFPQAVKSVAPDAVMPKARQQMVAKYGEDGFQIVAMAGRPIPTFKRIKKMIERLEPQFTDLDQVNAMIANLESAVAELDRIKDNLSS